MSGLSLEDDDDVPFEALAPKKAELVPAAQPPKPYRVKVAEHEIYLVSAVLSDPEQVLFTRAAHLPTDAFTDNDARSIWGCFQQGLIWPNDLKRFIERTKLSAAELFDIGNLSGIGLGFGGWLESVEEAWRMTRFKALIAEMAQNPGDRPLEWSERIAAIYATREPARAIPFADFKMPEADDRSVLLGDRFLNRGDAVVVSSTSGMGKSSLDFQMAACFALNLDFHGIAPKGPLKSLIIQAEDSEGDIAEMWISLRHAMKLTEEQVAIVRQSVIVVTERVRRGQAFLDSLKTLILRHKPDLVHINPLQAFMDGDVTDSKDLGSFLRAGLNGLNDPPQFGYVIIHHTTKPATGKEKAERLWHEVMYDMAGGAEIINWARAIMSLRAAGEPGEFNLVLAKRGTRAGVTKKVQINDTALYREEIVTSIALKHSTEEIEIPGRQKRLRCIFWESRTPTVEEEAKKPNNRGSQKSNLFADFKAAFPSSQGEAKGVRAIWRETTHIRPISIASFFSLVKDATEEGLLNCDGAGTRLPKYWLKK